MVGHQRVTFRQDGDKLVVHSELKIEVKVLSFVAYRYQQTRDEVWRNDKLIALASKADDDGTPHNISAAAASDGKLKVTSGKDSWTLPAESVPASYWNVSMVTAKGPLVELADRQDPPPEGREARAGDGPGRRPGRRRDPLPARNPSASGTSGMTPRAAG